ncbi:MAG TPA: FGGY family carbohydrate kinase [Ktedonobacterales bacterium]|nr:FGGY family carbohydrate kinase [Ktedonobacterales bacterium]
MDLFLGLDLGTSNVKALVMTDTGAIVARGAASYPLLRPRPGWAVQYPGAWWAALVEVLADLRARAVPLGRVAAGTTFFGKTGDGANTVGVQADPAT